MTEAGRDLLVDKGYDQMLGARPLRRAIQRYIEDKLSDAMLERQFPAGTVVLVDAEDEDTKLTRQRRGRRRQRRAADDGSRRTDRSGHRVGLARRWSARRGCGRRRRVTVTDPDLNSMRGPAAADERPPGPFARPSALLLSGS